MASKGLPDIKWIKIATNIFSDEKILLIEQLPDADTIIVIWFKLLCLAGRENNCGVFVMGGKIPYTDEMLATIFRRPIPTVRLALKTFEDFGMIEIIRDPAGNEIFAIPNWEKHQNVDGLEKIREQTRKRVANHRKNQRLALECNVTCNATVTEGNATEKEEEKEKEKEKEEDKKKEKKKEAARFAADDDLNSAIIAFIDYRKKIKKPMTERAIELLISELNKLSSDIVTQIEILNQSILNGWQGVFPLKQQNNQGRKEAVPPWMNKNKFNNFTQNDYDFEALEKSLTENAASNPDFEEMKQAAAERIKEVCS